VFALLDCGGACSASYRKQGTVIGAKPMRYVLAIALLLAFSASADAARVHHAKPRHLILRVSPDAEPRVDPRFPPVLQDQTPSYNDPSKFGGG
jgi:hypothetical protein